jgi:hypothetical protein
MEQSPREVTWSVGGSQVESDAVAKAFKLQDGGGDFRRGDAGPTAGKAGVGCGCLILILVGIIVLVLLVLLLRDDNAGGSSGYRSGGGSYGGYSSGGGHK